MQALRLYGARDARIEELPEPELVAGSVRIGVDWAGICGSDLRFYDEGPSSSTVHPLFNEAGPHVLGHEFAGTVLEVARDVSNVSVGDTVAIRPNVWDRTCSACFRGEPNLCENWGFIGIDGGGGGFSEMVVVPASNVHVLPSGVSTQVGALVESLTVAWHAAKRTRVVAGNTALVVGGGPIGLSVALCLRALGASKVFISEPSSGRRALAAKLGAIALSPMEVDIASYVSDQTKGGVDVSVDASGYSSDTFNAAYGSLRRGGTMVCVARLHEPMMFDVGDFLTSEKTVTGSFCYSDEDFAEVIEAIAKGDLDPTPLVSKRISLDHVIDGGIEDLLGGGRETEMKILVSPHS